jgi:hypothetical protein
MKARSRDRPGFRGPSTCISMTAIRALAEHYDRRGRRKKAARLRARAWSPRRPAASHWLVKMRGAR